MKNILFFLALGAVALASAAPTNKLPIPLTVDDALAYALEHSPSLQIVKQQQREQGGVMVQTFAKAIPSITASGSVGQTQSSLFESPAARTAGQKTWNAAITLRQSVFAGGSNAANVVADHAKLKAAKDRVTAAVEETILSVRQSFNTILVDREIISVRQEALDVLAAQLKNVKAKREAGVVSDFDVLQAEVAVANERPQLIRAQNAYRVALDQLIAVLGAPTSTTLRPEDVVGELTIEELNAALVDLQAMARSNRADLRAAHREAFAADLGVWSARGAYLPKVDFVGGYGWQRSSVNTQMDADVQGWTAAIQASVPLFDGFSNASKVYQAKARRREAQARETQTTLSVDVEVRQAYSGFVEAKEILKSAAHVVEQARESLRMAKARYDAGQSTQLDVLQAQSALSSARLTFLQSQYDYVVATARLQKATGSHNWAVKVTTEGAASATEAAAAKQEAKK